MATQIACNWNSHHGNTLEQRDALMEIDSLGSAFESLNLQGDDTHTALSSRPDDQNTSPDSPEHLLKSGDCSFVEIDSSGKFSMGDREHSGLHSDFQFISEEDSRDYLEGRMSSSFQRPNLQLQIEALKKENSTLKIEVKGIKMLKHILEEMRTELGIAKKEKKELEERVWDLQSKLLESCKNGNINLSDGDEADVDNINEDMMKLEEENRQLKLKLLTFTDRSKVRDVSERLEETVRKAAELEERLKQKDIELRRKTEEIHRLRKDLEFSTDEKDMEIQQLREELTQLTESREQEIDIFSSMQEQGDYLKKMITEITAAREGRRLQMEQTAEDAEQRQLNMNKTNKDLEDMYSPSSKEKSLDTLVGTEENDGGPRCPSSIFTSIGMEPEDGGTAEEGILDGQRDLKELEEEVERRKREREAKVMAQIDEQKEEKRELQEENKGMRHALEKLEENNVLLQRENETFKQKLAAMEELYLQETKRRSERTENQKNPSLLITQREKELQKQLATAHDEMTKMAEKIKRLQGTEKKEKEIQKQLAVAHEEITKMSEKVRQLQETDKEGGVELQRQMENATLNEKELRIQVLVTEEEFKKRTEIIRELREKQSTVEPLKRTQQAEGIQVLLEENNILKKQLHKINKSYQDVEQKNYRWQMFHKELEMELHVKENEMRSNKRDINDLQKFIRMLQQKRVEEATIFQAEKQKLEIDQARTQREMEKFRASLIAKVQQNSEEEGTMEVLKQQLEVYRADFEQERKDREELKAKNDELEVKVHDLERQINIFQEQKKEAPRRKINGEYREQGSGTGFFGRLFRGGNKEVGKNDLDDYRAGFGHYHNDSMRTASPPASYSHHHEETNVDTISCPSCNMKLPGDLHEEMLSHRENCPTEIHSNDNDSSDGMERTIFECPRCLQKFSKENVQEFERHTDICLAQY